MPTSSQLTGQPGVTGRVATFTLEPSERAAVTDLMRHLAAEFQAAHGHEFFRAVALACHHLPDRLRSFLRDRRELEDFAAFTLTGIDIDDVAIGPTPDGWGNQPELRSTAAESSWLALCGSVLGDLFGWAAQQGGAIVHDIAPDPADEHSQVGSSSAGLLWWHTEEAFHPLRCDYLGLLCLRNYDGVATTISSLDDTELPADVRSVLFEPRFHIRPDDSHLAGRRCRPRLPAGKEAELIRAAEHRIETMNRRPRRVALLSGDFDSPYLSIDPFYMDIPGDPVARAAFDAVCRALESQLTEIVLRPGQILFVDNYRAVHGRKPFRARYDGTDRWLKRINIARDLRKSRAFRVSSDSRIIY
ncbi:MAG TPA: guanitoxin biosynthesis L-enduracididine beta-hydroxylase GntD [Streptosporangiaceae bacterium]|jgi:Fe(II)/alpha-ketoglutarate-dependent arginine beta-hydroxylase|nr:guanitoxin biosynthesis L-enduracididine beta-hydroxylase GntD [Streptosporangiaceae bacterium]